MPVFVVSSDNAIEMALVFLVCFAVILIWCGMLTVRVLMRVVRRVAIVAIRVLLLVLMVAAGLLVTTLLIMPPGISESNFLGLTVTTALSAAAGAFWIIRLLDGGTTAHRPNPGTEAKIAERPKKLALLSDDIMQRLRTLEEKLAIRIQRDPLAIDLIDWAEFCRRRVPELLAATELVYTEASQSERSELISTLTSDIAKILWEGQRRIDLHARAERKALEIIRSYVSERVAQP